MRKQANFAEEANSSSDESVTVFPQSYVVIKFAPKANEKAVTWLVEKIKGNRQDGGAELLLARQPVTDKEGLILHVSASKIKFLQVAEEIEVVKRDNSGVLREFIYSQLEEFLEEGMHVNDFLTTSDKQLIVRHELENIRALSSETSVPGYSHIRMYEGKAILHAFVKYGIIESIYSLHDDEALKKLGSKWIMALFKKQPYEEIREYFGEAVALYFIFIGYYTTALVFPMILGFIQLFLSHETLIFFCIFNILWVTVFLEFWRRKSNELAFNWGTINMTSLDEPRSNYKGIMSIDPVTGKPQRVSPKWKTYVKMYCVSLPLVTLWLAGGFVIMLWSFWAEDWMKTQFDPDSYYIMIPSIVYTAIVYIMNLLYRSFATYLTEWENHRTQSQYDRHRVIKLVLFEFVNNFMSLFYIAFILQDPEMLRQQVAIMLIILQAINHVQEAILPLVMRGSFDKLENIKNLFTNEKKQKKTCFSFTDNPDCLPCSLRDIECLHLDDPRIEQAINEGKMEEYEGTYDDYLELFIQFGYVVLFSSVYPLAAFWAVANNVLEIRTDAFKLCKVLQRPEPRRVKDIGAWQKSFEIIGAMAIMTNCGLLWLSPQTKFYAESLELNTLNMFFYFVVLEHLLLASRYILHQVIPDKPEWVQIALARKNYVSKLALKNERRKQQRNTTMSRRFKSVYGTSKVDE